MDTPTAKPSFENTEIAFAALSNKQLKRSYHLFKLFSVNKLSDIGGWATNLALKFHLPIEPLVKQTIFKQFCGGETLIECKDSVEKLAQFNIQSILDYGVEGKSNEKDFDKTVEHQLKTLQFAKTNEHISIISAKVTGLGRFDLLAKVHAGKELFHFEKEEFERLRQRLHIICKAALENGTGIFFDAEETWIQQPLDDLIAEMMQNYNQQKAVVYNTYQLYRNDRLPQLIAAHKHAKQHGYILGAKLVRGAYMEKERERAFKLGYPSPIHQDKASVDKDYDAGLDYCVEHIDQIAFCCATHNEESCMHLVNRMNDLGIERNHPHVFFSQLYGMGEHITYNLAKAGFNSSKYIPYGPVKEVIPYLVRRAQENSSVSGQVGRELGLIKKEMKRRKLI